MQAGEHLNGDVGYTIVRVRSGDTIADVSLHSTADVSMRSWLGRRMRFRGVSGGLYNSRKQRYQGIVYVRSLQDMTLTDSVAAPSVGESPPRPLGFPVPIRQEDAEFGPDFGGRVVRASQEWVLHAGWKQRNAGAASASG